MENKFPTFEQYFTESEEAFYAEHPDLKDHPELDTPDGVNSGKALRKQQAEIYYGMELAAYNERRKAADKEAEKMKAEYESKLKSMYEGKGLECTASEKGMLDMLNAMDKKKEQEERSLAATLAMFCKN